jgi:hypothetical protein
MTVEAVWQIVAWHPLHVLLVAVVASHLVREGLARVAPRQPRTVLKPVAAGAPAA